MAVNISGDTGIDKITDGSIVTADFASGAITGSILPAGSILQVVQDTKTDTFTTSSTSFVDVTGLSVSITPSSASSKILIFANLNWNIYNGHGSARLYRDAVSIAKGDSAGSRIRSTWHNSDSAQPDIVSASMVWLDEPATTSATTYKIAVAVPYSGTYTVAVNRSSSDPDAAYQSRVPSSITVMEVAG